MIDIANIQISVDDAAHLLRTIDDHFFEMDAVVDPNIRASMNRINALVRVAITVIEKTSASIEALQVTELREE